MPPTESAYDVEPDSSSDAERSSNSGEYQNGKKSLKSFDIYAKKKEERATARKAVKSKLQNINA